MTVGPSHLIDILDVGHGSCVVVRSGPDVVLIDAGPGGAVLEYLRLERISRISAIVVSHADADHIGGISAILGQDGLEVDQIIWNGDSVKQTKLWKNLVYQIDDLQSSGRMVAQQNAHDGLRIKVGLDGKSEIHVLAPGLVLRQLGAGSSLRDGRAITSNSVSVVVQVWVNGEPIVMVPGDLDQVGYDEMVRSSSSLNLTTRYLLLPHHGGLMGNSVQTAASVSSLVSAVSPDVVFISNGRGKFGTPRPEVIRAVREAGAHIPISCTQLSSNCSVREVAQPVVDGPYSVGWQNGRSCQGSTRILFDGGIEVPLRRTRHATFVRDFVPENLCRFPVV